MAFTSLIRRSASTIAPLARRATQAQRHHRSAVFTALLNRSIFSPKPSSVSTNVFFQSRHGYSSSPLQLKRPSSDEALVRIIESEIQCAHESENPTRVEEIPGDFPFKIKDTPGVQTISLKREYQGESIVVEVHMPDLVGVLDEDGDDDDNNDGTETGSQSTIPLIVTVSKKNGPELEFGLTAYADEIEINSLILKDPEATEDQLTYEGPDFSDLDDNLQKAFHKYLEIRGIKPSTTVFLHEYMVDKDTREYSQWLINLKKFVEA